MIMVAVDVDKIVNIDVDNHDIPIRIMNMDNLLG
jgi:hypothetical protein